MTSGLSTLHLDRVILAGFFGVYLLLAGCAEFNAARPSELDIAERPYVAVLPFTMDVKITKLSYVKSVQGDLSPEDESRLVAETIHDILEEARWLFESRLAAGQRFRFVPHDRTDAAVADLDLKAGSQLTAAQLRLLRERLVADLLVAGSILDYGVVRWQWLVAGMAADTTAENIVLGIATSWNPAVIFGNIGFNLLTSTPVWFGGGYLFDIALRPVRAHAEAFDAEHGEEVWSKTEAALFLWRRLKDIPKEERAKKEIQLFANLSKAVEGLADSLLDKELTKAALREKRASPSWLSRAVRLFTDRF